MTPLQFLKDRNLSYRKLAIQWGIPTSTLFRCVKGQRWPSALVMVRFRQLSGGKIQLKEWIETCHGHLTEIGVLDNESSSNGNSQTKIPKGGSGS